MLLQPPDPVPLPAPAEFNWLDIFTDGRIDWGNAPSWLALLAAITAAIYAVRTFKQQASQIRALENEKRTGHAQQVAAWIEEDVIRGRLLIHVVNNSNLPAYTGYVWVVQLKETVANVYNVGSLSKSIVIRPGEMEINIGNNVTYPALAAIAFMDSGSRLWMRWGSHPLVELEGVEAFRELEERIPKGDERVEFDVIEFINKHLVSIFTGGRV